MPITSVGAWSNLLNPLLDLGFAQQTTATITDVRRYTDTHAVYYQFTPPEKNRTYEGYHALPFGTATFPAIGSPITVRYLPQLPEVNCVPDESLVRTWGIWSVAAFLFVFLLFTSQHQRGQAIRATDRLLEIGAMTTGTMFALKWSTPWMESSGKCEMTLRWTPPDSLEPVTQTRIIPTRRDENLARYYAKGDLVGILFNPVKPKECLLIDVVLRDHSDGSDSPAA